MADGNPRRWICFVRPDNLVSLLYGLAIMGHGRRPFVGLSSYRIRPHNVIANQLTEACGWEQPSAS